MAEDYLGSLAEKLAKEGNLRRLQDGLPAKKYLNEGDRDFDIAGPGVYDEFHV